MMLLSILPLLRTSVVSCGKRYNTQSWNEGETKPQTTNKPKKQNQKKQNTIPKKEDYVCCETHPIQASRHPY
jgi:hypothetical protein